MLPSGGGGSRAPCPEPERITVDGHVGKLPRPTSADSSILRAGPLWLQHLHTAIDLLRCSPRLHSPRAPLFCVLYRGDAAERVRIAAIRQLCSLLLSFLHLTLWSAALFVGNCTFLETYWELQEIVSRRVSRNFVFFFFFFFNLLHNERLVDLLVSRGDFSREF